MSADDCIAILETSVYPKWNVREYRVEHCQAIDNVGISPYYVFLYFNRSETFDTLADALRYARQLDSVVGPTEYGILRIMKYKQFMWEELQKMAERKVR
jgi:hypothetical protein